VHHFGVSEFGYKKQRTSGETISINFHLDWINYYFSEGLYLSDPTITHPDNHQESILFIQDIEDKPTSTLLEQAKLKFGVHYSMVLVYKIPDGVEFYVFGLTSSKLAQKMKLYNEIPLIRAFIRQFKEKFNSYILRLDDQPLDMLKLKGSSFLKPNFNPYPQSVERVEFLEQIGIEVPKSLTPKETQIVRLLVKGLSAPKIADHLLISPRTVEHHLERIRDKLNCMTKSELIQKIQQFDLCGSLNLFEEVAI